MGGQKFQYDESGGTFFYFLLSFLALLLIPGTYYCWPRKRKEDPEKLQNQCHCEGCVRKRKLLQAREPWRGTKELMIKVLIVAGWVILLLLAYKVSQFDYELANFDPYEILGVPFGAPQKDIKRAYRKLSLELHPDKPTGNEKAFMKLNKAYQALTDEEARNNWEKYGNPDGPGAMSFGIALPSWIVEKKNSVWVLGLYALVFMIALPTVVGWWWYNSIRYTGDQVLLGTTEIYYYLMHMSTVIPLKRCIMILGASLEFEKQHNSEVVERVTDMEEVPQLIKHLPNVNEKNKERPMCCRYSVKARALIHAHLSRIPLNPETLDKDRMLVIKKCPYLIQEMVHCAAALVLLAYSRRIPKLLKIFTIEHIMKMSPMVVQALWDNKSPLLQLPHVQEEHLKYFSSKKRPIKSIQQLAQMKAKDRRSIFRFLTDKQYDDVIRVMSHMPLVDFHVHSEVIDDEAPTVYTAGAIVTVTVTLTRRNMEAILSTDEGEQETAVVEEVEEEKEEEDDKSKKPAWQKQQRKQKKGSNKKGPKQKHTSSLSTKENSTSASTGNSQSISAKDSPEKEPAVTSPNDEAEDSDNEASNSEKEEDEDEVQGDKKENSAGEDNDEEWDKFQSKMTKRERVLEGRSKISHPVHCPLFPDDKQEYWWVYISDRKSQTLLTSPCHVTGLVESEEVQLRFTAPRWPAMYTFTVCLRSDSYFGFDQTHDIKLDVKEAPAVPTDHPQWEMSEEEEEPEDDGGNASEYTTDEDVEDDD